MARTRPILAAALVLTATAAAQGPPVKEPPACTQITVTAIGGQTRGEDPSIGPVRTPKPFSARQVLDLELGIVVPPGRKPAGLYVLRLFTPAGHLYEERAVPVKVDGEGAETDRRLEGYPLPVPVVVPTSDGAPVAGGAVVPVRLPVAGTAIVHHSLYGAWTAEVWTQGYGAPCATRSFSIAP